MPPLTRRTPVTITVGGGSAGADDPGRVRLGTGRLTIMAASDALAPTAIPQPRQLGWIVHTAHATTMEVPIIRAAPGLGLGSDARDTCRGTDRRPLALLSTAICCIVIVDRAEPYGLGLAAGRFSVRYCWMGVVCGRLAARMLK